MIYPYQTEPLTDFSESKNRDFYFRALQNAKSAGEAVYPLIIGDQRIMTDQLIGSYNPACKSEIVGSVASAGRKEADRAMTAALTAFKTWKMTDVSVRADILFKSAAILRRRRFEFNALLTLEAGKNWIEADADTAEAIDFLEYYGRQILELSRVDDKVLSRKNIERNEYRYLPLGVGVIITPWNFPLAILTGMTGAAIVSGNTVLLKPSSNTPVIAFKTMEVFMEAGLPAGVINFVPGRGSDVGDYLVNHPETRFVSFTGSKEVGISIYENAAVVRPGQIWLKRVIAEMGGKDTIIIDDDADLALAAREIVKSAFGFSGQKCSACSRVIIHQNVYDQAIAALVANTEKLKLGDPAEFTTDIGPVIAEAAFRKIKSYLEIGRREGHLITGGGVCDTKGWFIEPTIFIDCPYDAVIMKQEIFGPVLAIAKAPSFGEALRAANNTEYGLTGAVFSKCRENLELARREFHVGNLYFNRKCTGALVGYQPFGGFNMSGTDSKAGGPDYLILHMQGKTVTEQF